MLFTYREYDMVTDQIPTIKKSRLVRIGRVVFCWKTIIIHIDIIIHIIISALIVKTVHNVEAWWCGCKVQIGRSGIWDGPSFLTSMSWDSVGHTWSKSTSTSTPPQNWQTLGHIWPRSTWTSTTTSPRYRGLDNEGHFATNLFTELLLIVCAKLTFTQWSRI